MQRIGKHAFALLPLIAIGGLLSGTEISPMAFSGDPNLYVPNSIRVRIKGLSRDEDIAFARDIVFNNCGQNSCLVVPFDVEKLPEGVFYRSVSIQQLRFETDSKPTKLPRLLCGASFLKSVIIPESVTRVGARAFECSQLSDFEFGEGSQSVYVGKKALGSCVALKNVRNFHEGVTLHPEAFSRCYVDVAQDITEIRMRIDGLVRKEDREFFL
ncbi:MAG: leucine-rich repeat domain-containing protein [Holosporales bacterium]|nr:leucine-rich repeat domain-containing protein [Holosporales bacterium]